MTSENNYRSKFDKQSPFNFETITLEEKIYYYNIKIILLLPACASLQGLLGSKHSHTSLRRKFWVSRKKSVTLSALFFNLANVLLFTSLEDGVNKTKRGEVNSPINKSIMFR